MEKRDSSLPAPLLIPSLVFISGILIANSLPMFHHIEWYIVIPLFMSSFLLFYVPYFRKFKLVRNIILLLLILILGYVRNQPGKSFPENHIDSLLSEQDSIQAVVTGNVLSEARKTSNSSCYTIQLTHIGKYHVIGNVNLFTRADTLEYRDKIRALMLVKPLEEQTNPDMFDYKEYLINQEIFGTAIPLDHIKVIGRDRTVTLHSLLMSTRIFFFHLIDERFGTQSPFVKALIFGERMDLKDQTQTLTRGGLLHLIAISGMNILLIYGILYTILNLFLPRIHLRALLLLLMVFYAGLCSWTPSVVRAVIMIDLYLIAGIFERRIGTLQLIGASLLMISIIDPTQISSIGLQLSYTCVLVILLVFPKLSLSIRYAHEQLPRFRKLVFEALDILSLSVLICIFITPLTLYYFHQFGMNGVIGNTIGIPLIGAMLPLAMLVLILPGPLWVPFHSSYSLLDGWFIKWAEFSGHLPLFWNYLYFPWWELVLSIVILLSWGILLSGFQIRKRIILLVISLLLLVPIIVFRHPALSNPRITFFDVGVGDCSLLQTPSKNVMIDAGPITTNKPEIFYTTVPFLKKNGIRHLDYLILSHPHSDHIGGIPYLAGEIAIDSVAVNKAFLDDPEGRKIVSILSEKKCCKVRIIPDTLTFSVDDFTFHIIHPDLLYHDDNPNNESMVISLGHGNFNCLYTGDIEEQAESYILAHQRIHAEHYSFIKVPHHGSKTSGNAAFLSQIHPQIALINASQHNRFHFPDPGTVHAYRTLGTKVFITGTDGAVQMDLMKNTVHVKTWKDMKEYVFSIIK